MSGRTVPSLTTDWTLIELIPIVDTYIYIQMHIIWRLYYRCVHSDKHSTTEIVTVNKTSNYISLHKSVIFILILYPRSV